MTRRVPIVRPEPGESIFTDASEAGWGAHWGPHTVSGVWSEELHGCHTNLLEMEAVFLTPSHWSELTNTSVMVSAHGINRDNDKSRFTPHDSMHDFSIAESRFFTMYLFI